MDTLKSLADETYIGTFSHPENGTITVEYTRPAPYFDAAFDAIEWLGSQWETLYKTLRVRHNQDAFKYLLNRAGIDGFPVIAVYNHIFGDGAWLD